MARPNFNSVSVADEAIEGIADQLRRDQADLAVAIDNLLDAVQEADGVDDPEEIVDDTTLPFYEKDREMAFTIGLVVGGIIEAREFVKEDDDGNGFTNAEPSDDTPTSVPIS